MLINFSKDRGYAQYNDLITKAYEYAIKILKVPCKDVEVNLSYVSGRQIRILNREHRNKDRITDVLSFPNLLEYGVENEQLIADRITKANYPNDINLDTNNIMLGDICICKKVVKKQAKEYGNSMEREMVYMAVHGLLHLLGYDHILEEDKSHMREMEEKILKHINLERK